MNLEQGKKFHESYWDPYLPMIRDEVYEKLGRVEKRETLELFTIGSDEQESSSDDYDEIPMDSLNAISLSRRRKNPNPCSS